LSAVKREAPAPFPWREAMAFGLGAWRLSPREFWAATPRELFAAAQGARGFLDPPATRAALDELMASFPDEER
jgi:uncharacterized phage protein (TIGR02216 family)